MSLVSRALSVFRKKSTEGQPTDGPWWLPITGGWLSSQAGSNWNWWQMGYDVEGSGRSAMVEACVSAYAQTVAMCPGNHWAWDFESGGRERVRNSALTRILRKPNSYQSISDFLLNATRSLYLEGNAYALALRNERFEIRELHLMDSRSCAAMVGEDGSVFYRLSGNEVIDRMIGPGQLIVPARDVLHIRLHTPRHPLKGESPLIAAALQMAAGDAAMQQQLQFFINQSRPSFVLSTDQLLTREQVNDLRERWNEQSAGMNKGGTPILTGGLKADPIGISAEDSQLADLLKLSNQAITNVFRVPMDVLGIGSNTYASTEALMQFWLSSGLGFVLNHIEEAFGLLFKLGGQPDEYLEFDTSALQRSAFKDRVEAFARSVQGGIHAPNEARADFELGEKAFGDEPRVQQQVVPLSAWGLQLEAPAQPEQPEQPEEAADERTYDDFVRQIDDLSAKYQSVH